MSQVISERGIKHWLFRVGDGDNFYHSVKFGIWSLNTKNSGGKKFFANVKAGDILWFVTTDSNGHLVACGTYTELVERDCDGAVIALTRTNEELGWTDTTPQSSLSNYEVRFTDTYDVAYCDLRSEIKHRGTVCVYNTASTCTLDLPAEYALIVKYSPAQKI